MTCLRPHTSVPGQKFEVPDSHTSHCSFDLLCCFIKSGYSCITLLHTQDSCVLVTLLRRKSSNPLNDYNKSHRRNFHVFYLRALVLIVLLIHIYIYSFIHSSFIYSAPVVDYKISRVKPCLINFCIPK